MGVRIYDSNTRQPITPEEALRKSLDKRAYLQNYECQFTDENAALLTEELICAAEREGVGIDEQSWSADSLRRIAAAKGRVIAGWDIGRNRDLSVIVVLEKDGFVYRTLAVLRMDGLRKPLQDAEFDRLMRLHNVNRVEIDMTGLGVGFVDDGQARWGTYRVRGVNFSSTEPISDRLRLDGKKGETARVPEIMATDLLAVFESRAIEIPRDNDLHDDLRKPEKITSPGGRVSIAATRDEAGHADHFWAFALAIRAGGSAGPVAYSRVNVPTGMGNMGMGQLKMEVAM
jgi:phage FluMu gp28-like protein